MSEEPNPDLAESTYEVQQLHSEVMAEEDEPADGHEHVPIVVLFLFAALLMWGGYYIGTSSGDFRADVLDRPEPVRGSK